jgi:phosphoribosylanthranilate isomerase
VVRTRIKICGITRVEDAHAAAESGADAIGLVFYAGSARAISVAQALRIAADTPPFIARVGVFMNAQAVEVREILATVPLDVLQFHGNESPQTCKCLGRPYIKAVAMGEDADMVTYMARYPGAAGFLLDSHAPGQPGGSGKTIDWARVPARAERPLILAGGLSVTNVARAVRDTRPYGVDVSSGVESAKGIKEPNKIEAFVNEVKRVDCDQSSSA